MKKPELPNVRSRRNPSGKRVYYLDYFDPLTEKRERPTVGPIKADAHKRANQIYQEMMSHYLGEPVKTVADTSTEAVVEAYLNSRHEIRPLSLKRYRIYTENFLAFMSEHFPSITKISQIKKIYLEKFMDHLSDMRQAPGTKNAELRILKAIFQFAVDEEILLTNPASKIEKSKETKNSEKVEFWSIEEVKAILNEVQPHWRDAFEFLYLTGLRKGELIHLTWDDVDLNEAEPTIKIQAKEDWIPKTNQRRIIPLNTQTVEIIRKQSISDEHNFVFKGKNGGKINQNRLYSGLKGALKRLEFEGDVHKFRHTFASHLVMAGVGLETVSKLLGHSSIGMTMKYAHFPQAHLRKAINVLVEQDEED